MHGEGWDKMKLKKMILLTLTVVLLGLVLTACSSNNDIIEDDQNNTSEEDRTNNESKYLRINGIYVDNSFVDSENSSIKMVYVFYDAFTNDINYSISSKYSELTFDGTNTYSSEKYPGKCIYMENYYYSDYIEDVLIGNSLKTVSTFKIPEAELAHGKTMTFLPYGVPNEGKLELKTDDIIFANSPEEIALAIDPDGYASYQTKLEDADESTAELVKSMINGYEWSFYVNNIAYTIEFMEPNQFEVRTMLGANGGSYSVKNGYVSCTYDSNGTTVNIPWNFAEDDIDLDVVSAFDVH